MTWVLNTAYVFRTLHAAKLHMSRHALLELKQAFWRGGYSKCQACGDTTDIKKSKNSEGCRWNGDAYGTDVFTCGRCDWSTSFQWDDASEECYYFEVRGWPREPPAAADESSS
jgi:hypothetical protein